MSFGYQPAYLAASPAKSFSGRHKVHHTIILLFCVVVVIGSMLLGLNDDKAYLFGFKLPLRCFLYDTFGIKCSLCGLTRSFRSFAHGSFFASSRSHLLGPAIFAFICVQIPYRIWALTVRPAKPNKKIMKIGLGTSVLIIVALLVNWLVYLGGLVL
jgi:hypothetical protein